MSKTVTLEYPITVGEDTVKSLEFRMMTAGDLRVLDNVKGDAAQMLKLIELLASNPDDPKMSITPKTVDKIAAPDLRTISKEVADFLSVGREIGAIE